MTDRSAVSEADLLREGAELLYREASLLDRRAWRAWLDLYVEDCEFWMPAWLDEHTWTSDPSTQLSLIYYRDRHGLEDRIERIESGSSPASSPVPRTWHAISNIRFDGGDAESFHLVSNCEVLVYRPDVREEARFSSYYEHRLERLDGALKIRGKKIVLVNDHIPAMLDIYSI